MARMIFSAAAMAGAIVLAAGVGQAEKPNPFPQRAERAERHEAFDDQARRDFIRGGHVNIGVVFGGRNRDNRRGPGDYPARYPDRGCGDCDYGRNDDDWYREEAKRQAEWEREEAKRYYEQQREADKRYYEHQRESEKRFREQEREAWKRQLENDREQTKALREADRERFKGWRDN